MDQLNQTNNLQQAIDEVVAGKDEKNNNQFGIPPMPPTEGEGMPAPFGEKATTDEPSAEQILSSAMPAEPATAATEAPAEVAAPANEAPAAAAPVTEAPAAVETPVAPAEASVEAPADGDLASIRENVIKDLVGVIDKVDNATPEEKFGVYEEAMKTMHDAKTIGGAYRTATQISDENKKADALMGLMRTIDNA